MQNSFSKKNLLIFSGLLSFISLGSLLLLRNEVCDQTIFISCKLIQILFITTAPFIVVFVLSALMYKTSDSLSEVTKKFLGAVLLSFLLLVFLLSQLHYGGYNGIFLFFVKVAAIAFSPAPFIIIVWKWLSLRKKQAAKMRR